MKIAYYNYQEWKKECTRQKYIIGGTYSLAGDKKVIHRYAYDGNGEITGEFIHNKRRSGGYLNVEGG